MKVMEKEPFRARFPYRFAGKKTGAPATGQQKPSIMRWKCVRYSFPKPKYSMTA
jgi:hypothetical protein